MTSTDRRDVNQQQQQQIQLVGAPAPVQTVIAGPVDTPDGQRITLQITSVNGVFGFYLDAGHAKSLAALLEQYATQLETGLIIPGQQGLQVPA